MQLRSRRQTSPPMELKITENITKKKALRKKHQIMYSILKKQYKINKKNKIISF